MPEKEINVDVSKDLLFVSTSCRFSYYLYKHVYTGGLRCTIRGGDTAAPLPGQVLVALRGAQAEHTLSTCSSLFGVRESSKRAPWQVGGASDKIPRLFHIVHTVATSCGTTI